MNILGISGTPRRNGNSECLLNVALEPFERANWNIKRFMLSGKRVEPCKGCEVCIEQARILGENIIKYAER